MTPEEQRAFFEKYAPIAIDQQIKFGIPASVTLAQMALESGYGQSKLANNGNNYFGIKVHGDYNQAGRFGYYSDDRPNEKFCHYNSVEESVTDHSRLLVNSHYSKYCGTLSSTDYTGWIKGVKAAGYATDPKYVSNIVGVINSYNLDKYDQQAIQKAGQTNQTIGYMRGNAEQYLNEVAANSQSVNQSQQTQYASNATLILMESNKLYYLPVIPDTEDKINITSDYGMRKHPTTGQQAMHYGVDIAARYAPVFATEDQGKVTFVGNITNGGHVVKVEYTHADGKKYEATYMHLNSSNVKVGDVVNAGQQLGVSGNSGRSTGPHLHFEVKEFAQGDTIGKTIDPAQYLNEINVRSGFNVEYINKNNGQDILADYKGTIQLNNPLDNYQMANVPMPENSLAALLDTNNPNEMLNYLFMQNEEKKLGGSGDIIADLAGTIFAAAMTMASQLELAEKGQAQTTQQKQYEPIDATTKTETLIERQRESVDATKAQQLASASFEALNQENMGQSQNQGQRLA